MTIKKLKSIDIINVLSDLVSGKLEITVKLPIKERVIPISNLKQYKKNSLINDIILSLTVVHIKTLQKY